MSETEGILKQARCDYKKNSPELKTLPKEADILMEDFKKEKDPHKKYKIALKREKVLCDFYLSKI